MKKLIVLGFLMMQANNVECMLRQGVPVLKKGAQELGEGAYNWYHKVKGNFFSTKEEPKEEIIPIHISKNVRGNRFIYLENSPNRPKLIGSVIQEGYYGGKSNTYLLELFGDTIKKSENFPEKYLNQQGTGYQYLIKDNFSGGREKFLNRVMEKIQLETEKLVHKNDSISILKIMDDLLATEFKELKENDSIRKLSKGHKYITQNDYKWYGRSKKELAEKKTYYQL